MKFCNWNYDTDAFNAVYPFLDFTLKEVEDRYAILDSEVKAKIKHTMAHNLEVRKMAGIVLKTIFTEEFAQKALAESIAYHDFDKVIHYFATNSLDKARHKYVAKHHSIGLHYLDHRKHSLDNHQLVDLIEKLSDYEVSPLSKIDDDGLGAYQFVEKVWKGNQEVLESITFLGFGMDNPPQVTIEEYQSKIDVITDEEVISAIFNSLKYVDKSFR